MLGKASEIKTSGAVKGISGLDELLQQFPDWIILSVLISPGDTDYFYVIYKDHVEFTNPFEEATA